MKSNSFLFYLGLGLELFGLASVGLCLLAGLKNGDYGRLELFQFIGGSAVFYFGHYIKKRSVAM